MTAFWKKSVHGLVHKADVNHPYYRPELLVVFVHGILSSPEELWDSVADLGMEYQKYQNPDQIQDLPTSLPFARRILLESRIEADCLAFRYSASLLRSGSNKVAVELLKAALSEISGESADGEDENEDKAKQKNREARNLVFITHSNGGLVVKRLLVEEAASVLEQATKDRVPVAKIRNFTCRTRQVINICVPHSGARPLFSAVALLGTILALPLTLTLEVLRPILLNVTNFKWGFNSIGLYLGMWNPKLGQLHRSLLEFHENFTKQGIPFPEFHDFAGVHDLTIRQQRSLPTGDQQKTVNLTADLSAKYRPIQRVRLRMHGFHPASSLGMSVVKGISGCLTPFRNSLSYLAAERAVALTHYVDCEREVDGLLGDPLAIGKRGSQMAVFNHLIHQCLLPAPANRVHLVSGVAGVGKTRMISRLSRHLAIGHLGKREDHARRVFYIQLRDLDLRRAASPVLPSGASLYQRMTAAWISNARIVIPGCEKQVNAQEFLLNMDSGSYVLIMDGVDDFLHSHPDLHWEVLEDMLRGLIDRINEPDKDRILILSARTGTEGLRDFVQNPLISRCEVTPLENAEIESRYRVAWRLMQEMRDAPDTDPQKVREAVDLLRTPLVLLPLEKEETISGQPLMAPSLAQVLDKALRAVVNQTRYSVDFRPDCDAPQLAMDVLTIVARINYGLPDVLFRIEDIRAALPDIERIWNKSTAGHARLKAFDIISGRIPRMDAAERKSMSESEIAKVEKEDYKLLASILRTVFQNLAGSVWNYSHRSWGDFLVARYYALCAKYQMAEEFGALGYLPNITEMAGDLLGTDPETVGPDGKYLIPAALVTKARESARKESNLYYVCNALALAVWNRRYCSMDASALRELTLCLEIPSIMPGGHAPTAEQLSRVTSFQRCFILNGMVVNALQSLRMGGDAAAQIGSLTDICEQGAHLLEDRIFAHLCWCYLMHLSPGRAGKLPQLDLSSYPDVRATMIGVLEESNLAKRRSLQQTLVQLLPLVLFTPERRIATVHYLYMLVIIYHDNRIWIPETQKLLVEVFAPDSPYRILYAHCGQSTQDPQVVLANRMADLFDHCEVLYR